MKVFNLACEHDHRFEGWFGSADDYDAQLARGLLECPMCANRSIRKLPAAPRLNLSGATESQGSRSGRAIEQAPGAPATPPDPRAVQAMFMKMARAVIANTEDVGERFAEEARRIHYQEAPERGIRGVASPAQARELAEEGIEVFSLPIPDALKEPVQ
ncbi:MAG: DUF1178 family protein [Burkholderiaceae bacterium]